MSAGTKKEAITNIIWNYSYFPETTAFITFQIVLVKKWPIHNPLCSRENTTALQFLLNAVITGLPF